VQNFDGWTKLKHLTKNKLTDCSNAKMTQVFTGNPNYMHTGIQIKELKVHRQMAM